MKFESQTIHPNLTHETKKTIESRIFILTVKGDQGLGRGGRAFDCGCSQDADTLLPRENHPCLTPWRISLLEGFAASESDEGNTLLSTICSPHKTCMFPAVVADTVGIRGGGGLGGGGCLRCVSSPSGADTIRV